MTITVTILITVGNLREFISILPLEQAIYMVLGKALLSKIKISNNHS